MVEDVEAVRQGLGLGKISLLGHSYGGALAQAYALKYQQNLSHLILASTWSSTDGVEPGLRAHEAEHGAGTARADRPVGGAGHHLDTAKTTRRTATPTNT